MIIGILLGDQGPTYIFALAGQSFRYFVGCCVNSFNYIVSSLIQLNLIVFQLCKNPIILVYTGGMFLYIALVDMMG